MERYTYRLPGDLQASTTDRQEIYKLRQHVHKRLYQLAKAYMANKEAGHAHKHLEREIGCLKYMIQATSLPEHRLKKLEDRRAALLKKAQDADNSYSASAQYRDDINSNIVDMQEKIDAVQKEVDSYSPSGRRPTISRVRSRGPHQPIGSSGTTQNQLKSHIDSLNKRFDDLILQKQTAGLPDGDQEEGRIAVLQLSKDCANLQERLTNQEVQSQVEDELQKQKYRQELQK